MRRTGDRSTLCVKVREYIFIYKVLVHRICVIKDTYYLPVCLCCCEQPVIVTVNVTCDKDPGNPGDAGY